MKSSVPPYFWGGTDINGGAMRAIFMNSKEMRERAGMFPFSEIPKRSEGSIYPRKIFGAENYTNKHESETNFASIRGVKDPYSGMYPSLRFGITERPIC